MPTQDPSSESTYRTPPRVIGGVGSFALVAGSMLGIGIFIVPPVAAANVPSEIPFLLVWLVAGALAFAGAVACAELGTMFPRAGGDYVFQSKAFGKSVAFASGWVLFAAIFAGSIATMSMALCKYQLPVLGLDLHGTNVALPWGGDVSAVSLVAIGIIVVLTAINSIGALVSSRMQTLLIGVPMVALAVAAVVTLFDPPSVSVAEWVQATDALLLLGGASGSVVAASSSVTFSGIIDAYVAVYFAYSGWNAVIYVAGEIRNPDVNIPRSLLSGTLVVTCVYILLCLGFLAILGMAGLQGSGEAGTASAGVLGGRAGQLVVTVLIAMALFAGINSTVMGGARVAFAMGRGGAFIKAVGKLSPRTQAPVRALWLQALWAGVLILSGSFEQLLTLTSLAMLVTGTLTVTSVFVLRRTMPDAPRPYRALGFPFLPAIYVLASVVVIGWKAAEALTSSTDGWIPLFGLIVLGVAFMGHHGWTLWTERRRRVLVGLMAAVISGGILLGIQSARAESLDVSPYAALEAGATAAADNRESVALRSLYATIACKDGALPIAGKERYCSTVKERLGHYRRTFTEIAGPWIAKRRPAGLPETVLYPFSGADLVSSVLAFPDARLHVHLSLEHGGPVDALVGLTPKRRGEAMRRLLRSARGLLRLGDSKTKDLRLAHLTKLPGKLPIALLGLAAHDAEVVAVRYFRVMEDGTLSYFRPDEMAHRRTKGGHRTGFDSRWSNVEFAFRLPGDPRLRFMQHVAADLSNQGLAKAYGQGVTAWIKSLGKVSFMTKAATYLLWSSDFTSIRSMAIAQSAWMISDASGIRPMDLPKGVWKVTPYGTFKCDLLDWRKSSKAWARRNDEMAAFFAKHSREGLKFRFGYVDCLNYPSVMISTRK